MNNALDNPKYVATIRALESARKIDILSKQDVEETIAEIREESSMPTETREAYIWNVYKKHEPERFQSCIDVALRSAKRNSITDKMIMESWIGYAREHSDESIEQSVIDRLYQEYEKHEPDRRNEALETALRSAKRNSITDKMIMESWIGYAREHSDESIEQSVIDRLYQEYEKHEPDRRNEALETALRYVKGDSRDKNLMESWIGYAQEHSIGWVNKITTYLAGLGIKGRFALRSVVSK